MLVYALVAGVLFGLYFSLVGIGLNLVFGVMRIVNLAHGDILMLGAFVAFGVVTLAGIDPLFAVPLAFVIFLAAGLLLYWVLVPRLQGSVNPEMLSIILFFGLSQVIEAVTTIFFGTSERSIQSRMLGTVFSTIKTKLFGGKPGSGGPVQIFGQGFPASWVIAAITSLIAITLVYVYLYRTRLGIGDRHRCRSRLRRGVRHWIRACRGGRRVRALHVRIGDAGIRRRRHGDVVCHRGAGIARQSLRDGAGWCGLWHLLHGGADLSQFMGRSSALCALDLHPAAPSQRSARKAGARCLAL